MDGSVLFASLLRAINIEPILVRTPGHMFVGYYTDNSHKDMNFLETTMIGDVDLDDFFPYEQLDSTMVGKSQNQMSPPSFYFGVSRSLSYRLYLPAYIFRNLQEHIVQLAGMNAFLVFLILLIGILFRLLKGDLETPK